MSFQKFTFGHAGAGSCALGAASPVSVARPRAETFYADEGQTEFAYNSDATCTGNLKGGTSGISEEECRRRCREKESCNTYVYEGKGGKCYLKNEIDGDENYVTGHLAERIHKTNKGELKQGYPGSTTDIVYTGHHKCGKNVNTSQAFDAQGCKLQCRGHPDCDTFVFHKRSGKCWLKQTVSDPDSRTNYKTAIMPKPLW